MAILQPIFARLKGIYQNLWHTFVRSDSNYELEKQVAKMRKEPGYQQVDIPPPTMFPIKCHPRTDEICAQLDDYFYKNWPWKDEAAGQKFLRSETNRWACLALPNAKDDRIYDSVRVNTLLFLLDGLEINPLLFISRADVAEDMSMAEGQDLYKRLIPLALGKAIPNRADPYEWITYDTWKSMRAKDPELTEVVWQGALLCIMAQVDEARMKCADLGSLLKHRAKEAGIAFVAAVLRFGQGIHISPSEISSIEVFNTLYALLGVTVNDVLSFDKELRAFKLNPTTEGAHMLNMTLALANDTGLPYSASKRVLWVLVREWEEQWKESMIQKRNEGVSKDLGDYLEGMEWVLGGNEWWSWRTERYQETKLV
ncbi:MAG: hypothetical protein Q9220_002411 [cf. Caloplaca sp. 1 TL-2023]